MVMSVFLGVVLGIVIMSATCYLALDKKSNFLTRVVSLGALAVMIITVIISVFVILSNSVVPVDKSILIVGKPVEKPEETNYTALIITIFFFIVMFVVIVVLAMREHKKSQPKKDEIAI